jgi:hypothetical protein
MTDGASPNKLALNSFVNVVSCSDVVTAHYRLHGVTSYGKAVFLFVAFITVLLHALQSTVLGSIPVFKDPPHVAFSSKVENPW